MDAMLTKHKEDFISAMNATIDMLQNNLDLLDIKKRSGALINNEEYIKTKDNIDNLNRILLIYKNNEILSKEDEAVAIAAMGTVVVHLEYLAECYKIAAEKAKIIIANIESNR